MQKLNQLSHYLVEGDIWATEKTRDFDGNPDHLTLGSAAYARRRPLGCCPQWLHGSPQLTIL